MPAPTHSARPPAGLLSLNSLQKSSGFLNRRELSKLVSTNKQGRVVPWSYSSLQQYETCPRRFHLTRILKKVVEPQTQALVEGNEVHKALELACAGTKPLPEKYAAHQKFVDSVQRAPGTKLYEFQFGLTEALAPCDFWDRNVWVRGKLDVVTLQDKTARILDWKNGKRKVDIDQLRLFALAGFATWPYVETVKTGYVWLLGGTIDPETFKREQKVEIHQDFAARVFKMKRSMERDEWEPRPSGLCRDYCPVGRSLCEYCGTE